MRRGHEQTPSGGLDNVRETMVRFVSGGTNAFIVSHSEGLFGADTHTVRFRQVLIDHQDYLRVSTDGAGLTYVR